MKKLFLAIFIILFPYSIVLLITSLFHTTLMKYLFHNNIYIGVFYIGTLWIIALISAIFICIKNIINNNNALETAKINMIIKESYLKVKDYVDIYHNDFYQLKSFHVLEVVSLLLYKKSP